jgi:CBS domain-containing protein
MKIGDILSSKGGPVITIRPEQTLKAAVDLLEQHDIGGVVVLDHHNKIIGILTERDLIRYAAGERPEFSTPVKVVMTTNVIVGSPKDDINTVAHTMTEKRFRHLPIIEGGELIGIVTIGDIVKAQRDRYEGEIHTLHMQITADLE